MTTVERIIPEVETLSQDDKLLVLERLASSIRKPLHRMTQAEYAKIVQELYGAFADNPIERPYQGSLVERET